MWSTGNTKRRLSAASEKASENAHGAKRLPDSGSSQISPSGAAASAVPAVEMAEPAAAEARALKDKKGRKKKERSEESAGLAEAATAIAKLTLQNTALIRELRGSEWTTFMLPGTNPVAMAALQAGKNYDADVRAAGPKHDLGSPHLHAVAAFCEAVAVHVAEDGSDSIPSSVKTYFPSWWETFRSKPKEEWGRLFPYFRVRKIYWREDGDDKVLLNYKINGTHCWSEGDRAGLAVFDTIS